jgi:hypothetical protein
VADPLMPCRRLEYSRVLEEVFILSNAEQHELLLEDTLEDAERRQLNLCTALSFADQHGFVSGSFEL